ncbi:MAG TPA: uracil-DNA glycosylase [Terriglobia bacterium]|nr:uracil-DNA glycosylase [Terriglobia bacterium]
MTNDEMARQIADWIEFFRDLGFDEFYRGPELEALARNWSPAAGDKAMPEAIMPAPANAAGKTPEDVVAGISSGPVPEPHIPQSSPARLHIVPPRTSGAHSMSLFEAESPVPERRQQETLDQVMADLGDCHRCKLAGGRTHIVFGQGSPKAQLVFVGEGPGADEDEQGLPFVGRAGQLLNRMLQRVDIRREDVYICNVVKCRPPGNRTPEKDEIETCSPFLFRQIRAIQPRLICCLGMPAVRTVLGIKEGITRIHGRFYDFGTTKAMATVHPAYVLRNPREERILVEDFQKIRDFLLAR